MLFDEFAAEIESKPCSCDLRGTRILCAYETAKNSRLLLERNANAPISNGEERGV